jgi:hypothetical protein
MDRESDNICLVPYNFEPKYSVEETDSRHYFILLQKLHALE